MTWSIFPLLDLLVESDLLWFSHIWLVFSHLVFVLIAFSQFHFLICLLLSWQYFICWYASKFYFMCRSLYIYKMYLLMTVIFIASVITDTYFPSLRSVSWTSNPHFHFFYLQILFFFMIVSFWKTSQFINLDWNSVSIFTLIQYALRSQLHSE